MASSVPWAWHSLGGGGNMKLKMKVEPELLNTNPMGPKPWFKGNPGSKTKKSKSHLCG